MCDLANQSQRPDSPRESLQSSRFEANCVVYYLVFNIELSTDMNFRKRLCPIFNELFSTYSYRGGTLEADRNFLW